MFNFILAPLLMAGTFLDEPGVPPVADPLAVATPTMRLISSEPPPPFTMASLSAVPVASIARRGWLACDATCSVGSLCCATNTDPECRARIEGRLLQSDGAFPIIFANCGDVPPMGACCGSIPLVPELIGWKIIWVGWLKVPCLLKRRACVSVITA